MTKPVPLRTYIRSVTLAVAIGATCLGAQSQTPLQAPQTVQWHAAVGPASTLRPGQYSTIELTGQILEGWHVYGLKQHANGPTELKFSVDDNAVVQPTGAPTGTDTIRRMDPGFGFEIQYYTDWLKLTLPIQIKGQAGAGKQQIPVSVRFQSCSDRTCLPPATIHLLVDLNVEPHV